MINVDMIYIINLKKCKDRLNKITNMMHDYNLPFTRFEAIKHKIGSYGCQLSHNAIIKDAKEKGYKRIMIFEDDAIFLYPKDYIYKTVNNFIKEDFDIGYIGGNFAWDTENDFNPDTLECKCLGRFGIIVKNTAYDYLLNIHPTLQQFKSSRDRRGDVSYAQSILKKKCMRYPVVGVSSHETYTYTNCAETKKPLSYGEEHFTLILSSYYAKGMVDEENIIRKYVYKLFADINKCVKYGDVIRLNSRNINPFNYIDVKIINLDTDIDRWLKMVDMCKKYGISPNRFKAIRNKNGWGGSTASHRQCVVEAKEKGAEKVLIFEDDVYMLLDRETTWSRVRDIIGLDYDIAYLGCTLIDYADKLYQSNHIYRVHKCWGVWAYIVDSQLYDEFISLIPSDPEVVSREKRNISDVLVHDFILPRGKCILTPIMSSYDGWSYNWDKERQDTQNMIINAYKNYLQR